MSQLNLIQFEETSIADKQKLYSYIYKKSIIDIRESNLSDFTIRTLEWCQRTVSDYYAIFYQNEIVGTISLSKQNIAERTACVGYEIFDEFRSRGFASQAFELVLTIAVERGFKEIKATIAKDNQASLKIWQKRKAVFRELQGNKLEACLLIGQ